MLTNSNQMFLKSTRQSGQESLSIFACTLVNVLGIKLALSAFQTKPSELVASCFSDLESSLLDVLNSLSILAVWFYCSVLD